jgi:hypothetical protein
LRPPSERPRKTTDRRRPSARATGSGLVRFPNCERPPPTAPACRRSATPDRISKTAPVGPAARARPRARPPPVSSPPRSARRCSGVTACHGPPERPERSADASVRPAACHLPRPATAPYLRMRRESPHRQTPAQTRAKNGRIGIDSNRETSKILTFVERVSSVCGETEGPTEGGA